MNHSIRVKARWRDREESAVACASRTAQMLSGMATLHPAFAKWNQKGYRASQWNRPFCLMPPQVDDLTKIFEKERHMSDTTPRYPFLDMGFAVHAWSGDKGAHSLSLSLNVGAYASEQVFPNSVNLEFRSPTAGNADLLNLDLLKAVLGVVVDAWQPDTATIGTMAMGAHFGRFAYRADWVTYLPPGLVAKIGRLQPGVRMEPTLDGGVLVIAGKEPLDPDNPMDIVRAEEIQLAYAQINAAASGIATAGNGE